MQRHYKFDIIEVNRKLIHKYKQPINLNLVDTNKILISDRFNHNNDSFNDINDNDILLATKKTILLDLYVLFYLK